MSSTSEVNRAAGTRMREHWLAFLLEGIVLVLLGLCAVLLPAVASLTVTFMVGSLFLISGVAGFVSTLWARRASGFAWSLFSALLALAAGAICVFWPLEGVLSLTVVLAVFFCCEGIASIMLGVAHRRDETGRWVWLILSGVVDLALAAVIMVGLPGSSLWVLGGLLGINLVFGGSALIAMALHARLDTESEQPR